MTVKVGQHFTMLFYTTLCHVHKPSLKPVYVRNMCTHSAELKVDYGHYEIAIFTHNPVHTNSLVFPVS